MDSRLLVRIDLADETTPAVVSPGVGWWSSPPPNGTLVGPGSSVGRLRCLTRDAELWMPDGVAGRVVRQDGRRVTPVAFGETLFILDRLEGGQTELGAASALAGGTRAPDLPAGTHAVTAPTEGVFYSRPAPDAAPFVTVGVRVHDGQPVGLVEVMKTFSQILYGGPGLPAEAEVLEVRCADGEEISSGQVLIVVR